MKRFSGSRTLEKSGDRESCFCYKFPSNALLPRNTIIFVKPHIATYVVGTLAYETKEEVMEWMLDIQLGRRNLSPIQRIAIAEKYRSLYEKQARENQIKAGKEYGNGGTKLTEKLPQALDIKNKKERNPTTDKRLSDMAGISEKTYRMGAKILKSDNEEVKKAVLSGEMSINAGYNKIREKKVAKI